MKKIALISDTHYTLDVRFLDYFNKADEIWHAGDIGDLKIIDELKKNSIIRAVHGNIDNYLIKAQFKSEIYFKCEEVNVLMTHIGGYPGKYNKNIICKIEKFRPDLFICGHSHILKVMYDKKYKLLHMNPGALGDYGQHKVKTLLYFIIDKKEIKELKVIEYPRN